MEKFNGALSTGKKWCDEWDKIRKELMSYDKERKDRIHKNNKKDKQ